MKRILSNRLQSLEAALTPQAKPSTALWLLKGETIEEGVERYRRDGIALASLFLPVYPAMTTEEWLYEYGGGEWEVARLARKASTSSDANADAGSMDRFPLRPLDICTFKDSK